MKKKLIRITTVPISLKVLLKGQLKYMNDFFDVIAVSSNGKEMDEVENIQKVKTKRINMSRRITPFKDFISLVEMTYFFIKEKPDIVHTHTPKAGIIGMTAAWLSRVPVRLHTVAGMPLMEVTGKKKDLLLLVEMLTYKFSTKVYPNSVGLKDYILANNLTNNKKIKVIGNGSSNGIDTNFFKKNELISKEGELLIKKYGIMKDDFVFIFVGRIVRDKGVNELLEAFNNLDNHKAKLLLVGNFEDELDPISYSSRNILKSNKNIISVGYQNDVRPFFAVSDCFVFPSYREGFPNVVMQAGAMGLPSIVTNINGSNEIIKNGKNGIIIPSKSTVFLSKVMEEIIDDEILDIMKKNARKMIVDRYSQNQIWKLIKNEYYSELEL